MKAVHHLLSDQQGAAAIQYAVIAGVLTLAVLAGSLTMRGALIDLYEDMGGKASAALTAEPVEASAGRKDG